MSAPPPPGTARRQSWLASPPPSAAVEISSRQVAAVAVAEQGGTVAVSGYAAEPLPAGAIEPGLNAVNVHDPAALAAAIGEALRLDAAEQAVFARRARAHVAASFTREAMCAKTIDVYEELLFPEPAIAPASVNEHQRLPSVA